MKFDKIIGLNLIALSLLIIDRLTKAFIIKKVPEQGLFFIEKDYFTFGIKFFANKNLAFSIPFPQTIIIVIVIIIILYLVSLLIKYHKDKKYIPGFLIMTIVLGAVSNLFDRLYYGYVIDFINVYFGFFKFAVFNIADAMIVLAALGLIIYEYKKQKNEKIS